tara:strand:- start:296 stop:838 length:543 start_codon:yes stop_codon:yes gene_type:complete
MTEETKQIIDVTLNALSVFGTLAAVVVALYLAGQARKERIRGRAGIRIVGRAGGSESATVVLISATNLSDRPITVSAFGWRFGILKKQSFVQIPDFSHPMCDGLPKKIEYGDSVNLVFDIEKFFSAPGKMCDHLSLLFPWLTKRNMFCLISTTGSQKDFKIRLESNLADRFIEETRKTKA